MEFEEIIDGYVKKTNNYYEKRQKLEDTIERAKAKLSKLSSPSWIQNILVPIAKEIKKRMGFKAFDIYGPFGCECETSVYFSNEGKDNNIEITKVSNWSFTVRPEWKYNETYAVTTGFNLSYRTGKSTNQYATGTIGELNGLNDIYAPLPETIEEIIKLLEFHKH